MAIKKACSITNKPKNTGKECDTAMVATAMLLAFQPGITFNDTDLSDPVTWLDTLIHQKKVFPLFGQKAPIREIKNDKEQDVLVTLDDGLKVFLRYGLYNRQYATTSGGLCYAAALQSFLNSGYNIVEVDQAGQLLARLNSDGTYGALITDFMYSPSPDMADFKATPYKNWFAYSYSPVELVNNGIIFNGASALLSMMGLIDATITEAAPATATKLKIAVTAHCSGEDLIAKFGSALGTFANNFVVTDSAGVVQSISAAAIVTGWIELTGTFTSGQKYTVTGAAPTQWKTNGVSGYDGSTSSVTITIP